MKKVWVLTLVGLATAALTSVTHAGYLDNVGVYGSATYTKPSNNGLSIGEIQTVFPSQGLYSFDRALFLEPEFNWDYTLGISFHFPCTDTRAFFEYDYFNDTVQREVSGLATLFVYPHVVGVDSNFGIPTTSKANVQENSKEWRLGLRHFIPVTSRFFLDLSGYFEYDRVTISTHKWNTFNNPTDARGGIIHQNAYYETNNQLTAWGPGAGLKLIGVPLACRPTFTLFAGIMTTLFYAKNSYDDNVHVTTLSSNTFDGFPGQIDFKYNPEFSQSILTKIDINMGADYTRVFTMSNGAQFRAGITLGVRYLNIFNAFKNGNVAGLVFVNAGNSFTNQDATFLPAYGVAADWGRVGPYVQFRLGGCDA